ncbi:Os04g0552250, partial [Oryza sativa Japonica Group]
HDAAALGGVVHGGSVGQPGLPPGGDDVVGDEHLAGARGEPDRERRAQRLPGVGVEAPGGAPRLLHRLPPAAAAGLHDVHRGEVAVAVRVLDQDGEVVRVGARVHLEGHVHGKPARHPA